MKLLAPLIFALTLVAAHPQGSDGLQNRPTKRSQDLEKKDGSFVDSQPWKRTGDWHHGDVGVFPQSGSNLHTQDNQKKCSDFYCRLECKKQGFCRSECKGGRCKCSIRQDWRGKCNVPSKKPYPPGPKPTSTEGDD